MCFDALFSSQQFFSHVGMISYLPGLNQHYDVDSVSLKAWPAVSLELATLRSPVKGSTN